MHEAEHPATRQCSVQRACEPQGRELRREAETHGEYLDELQSRAADKVRLVACHFEPVDIARYLLTENASRAARYDVMHRHLPAQEAFSLLTPLQSVDPG